MQNSEVLRKTAKNGSQWGLLVLVFLLALTFLSLSAPQQALAEAYSIDRVAISASVETDADLAVEEVCTYAFSAPVKDIELSFESISEDSTVYVQSVVITEGNTSTTLASVPFEARWKNGEAPEGNLYSYDNATNTLHVFGQFENETVTITTTYRVTSCVGVYQDVAELYWKFIGEKTLAASRNVSLMVSLPLPSGVVAAAGENVRAWGHGPEGAAVSVNADGTVAYMVEEVPSDMFAEVRIIFPPSWLTGVKAESSNVHPNESHLSWALNQEQIWFDWANVSHTNRLLSYVIVLIATLIVVIMVLLSMRHFARREDCRGEEPGSPSDVLNAYHPAVVSRMLEGGCASVRDFAVTLVTLVEQGALVVRGRDAELRLLPSAGYEATNEVDRVAYGLLTALAERSSVDAAKTRGSDELPEKDEGASLSALKTALMAPDAKDNRALTDWESLVQIRFNQAELIETYTHAKRYQLIGLAVILNVVGAVVALAASNMSVLFITIVATVAFFIAGLFLRRNTTAGMQIDYALRAKNNASQRTRMNDDSGKGAFHSATVAYLLCDKSRLEGLSDSSEAALIALSLLEVKGCEEE